MLAAAYAAPAIYGDLAQQAPAGRLVELPGRHLVQFSAAAATAALVG